MKYIKQLSHSKHLCWEQRYKNKRILMKHFPIRERKALKPINHKQN